MNKEKNPLKLSWRNVIDCSNVSLNKHEIAGVVWMREMKNIVRKAGYGYYALGGIVYDLSHKEICTVYDLIPC